MARYKHSDAEYGQGQFLTVNLQEQLLPGTYEYMLDDIIEHIIDTSVFDLKYKNDETGASAINPKALLKLVFYGYSKDRKSSRGLWDLSQHHIIAKALTRDTPMHWTTIADFISGNSEAVKELFVKVLAYCDELGLIGGQTFAIDGLRLPSNASLALTGTEEELKKKLEVYKRMAAKHIERHKKKDERGEADAEREERYKERQKDLSRQIEKISDFLESMEKKTVKREREIRSNVTDNERALIMSGGSYIQGYIGIVVADQKNQVIVSAEAVGSANESERFADMRDKTLSNMRSVT
jgi:transposase